MFSLSELASLPDGGCYKLLKPWWEVFMEYLVVLMLMVSVWLGPSCYPGMGWGRRTHLDYQQYVYIAQVCYHEALPWYSRFFPYVALLQSLALLAGGSFWFHFPRTSSRIEHFLAILGKCCESPWTSRALSLTAQAEANGAGGGGASEVGGAKLLPPSPLLSRSPSIAGQSSLDSGTDSPLLVRSDSASTTATPTAIMPPSPCPSALSRCSSLSSVSFSAPSLPLPSSPPPVDGPPVPDGGSRTASLDRSDGEQARALFERVRRFRAHCESSDIIYKVYLTQTVFKVLQFVLIMSYTAPLLGSMSFSHRCEPQAHALTGYSAFQCTHSLASVLRKLLLAYLGLVGLFGVLGIYTLSWVCHRSLRQYSFSRLRESGSSMQDVPDLCNDLAFLLHMADQYDPLLAQRLSVFLSPLVALPRLPRALFSLAQLEVLKLELISEAKLTAAVSGMTSLRELHLYHCPAAVEPGALPVLRERLEALHLTFTQASEIPTWVYTLRGLQELHLTGRLSAEGGGGTSSGGRGWALASLRQLRHLRTLVLQGALLQRVPSELGEVSGSLLRLEVHNEGARLLVLTGLRRVSGLAELQLQGCQLECLPSALLSLAGLRSLDLCHNALRTLEGLLGLQHLRRLSTLRLAHNRVLALPASVGMLRALELLDLGHNQLQSLPPALFTLHRLRRLLVAGNLLEDLPAEVAALTLLSELDLSGNKLEQLPPLLPAGLRTLNVAHNSLGLLPASLGSLGELSHLDVRGNSLETLPAELGSCTGLRGGGLLVEDWLLLSLPPHVRQTLLQPDYVPPDAPAGAPGDTHSHSSLDSDGFPAFSATQWSFLSALESRI
ncbi:hypothetical protein AGOR_G00222490 [Albula goreensis]|uniref:LRRC8 pannexin-like TM region domain-containing protein n=1 Tax=Albula goreensis TaxID=1534307 RepID=A0A8T3CG61_9TELE|nr:hypothetical protein AGOR_G00222490 [Albula goreensis]